MTEYEWLSLSILTMLVGYSTMQTIALCDLDENETELITDQAEQIRPARFASTASGRRPATLCHIRTRPSS